MTLRDLFLVGRNLMLAVGLVHSDVGIRNSVSLYKFVERGNPIRRLGSIRTFCSLIEIDCCSCFTHTALIGNAAKKSEHVAGSSECSVSIREHYERPLRLC